LTYPAHWRSTIEHVTVTSGVLNMGVGDKLDNSKTQALGPGSVSIMQAGTHHFGWFGEDAWVMTVPRLVYRPPVGAVARVL
jgi:hypothetical protein